MPIYDRDRAHERFSREEVMLLGFTLEDYGDLSLFTTEDRPEVRLGRLMNQPGSELARETMLKNVRKLEKRLSELPDDTADFDIVLREIIQDIAIESALEIPDTETRDRTIAFIDNLWAKGELFDHLEETANATSSLSNGISRRLKGDNGQLLSRRQLDLMEFVARTHDLPKLLGGLNAQIDPDHEVIYRKVIGRYLVGKKFRSSHGEVILSERDRDFCVGLAGFHEDIWREAAFAKQVDSFDRNIDPESDQDTAIERARMMFHFLDIFGNSLGFDKRGFLVISDRDAFQSRFIDLYRRHINLPIKVPGKEKTHRETNWTRAKVYRPEWGLHGVAGLTWTFEALSLGWHIKIEPTLIEEVQLGILEVINSAMDACEEVLNDKPTEYALVIPPGPEPEDVRRKKVLDDLAIKRDNLLTVWEKLFAEIH